MVENQNLAELFKQNVTIGGDKIFFYNNPMLCTDRIRALKINNPNITIENEDQLGANNGDRATCSITTLKTTLKVITHNTALIEWEKYTALADARQLLGYVFYYIEAPGNTNVSLFDGRDACNTEGWRLDDIGEDESIKFLTQLKPFTRYGYYVSTYTLASEGMGGRSEIAYFTTAPSKPFDVRHATVEFDNDNLVSGNRTD